MKEMAAAFQGILQGKPERGLPAAIRKSSCIRAVEAVFRSWNNPRAIYYRKMNDIPGSWGTAVNVQMMVFGNMGNDLRHRRRVYA